MSNNQPEIGTIYMNLIQGETLRIGEDITITRAGGKLKITAPKCVKVIKLPAKPIDMGDASGLQ